MSVIDQYEKPLTAAEAEEVRHGNPKAMRSAQKLSRGADAELFILDLSTIGINETYHFTAEIMPDGSNVRHDGIEYIPVPVEAEGFEYDGQGPFPQPVIRVSNTNKQGFLRSILKQHGDLVNARITRFEIPFEFLDGQPDEDPEAIFPPDIYTVFQKKTHTKTFVEFLLSAEADQEGQQLPRGTIQRDTCRAIYRVWNEETLDWDYSEATCPFTGNGCWTPRGAATTPDKDDCGLQVSDCKLRFPKGALPFDAYPGILRSTI